MPLAALLAILLLVPWTAADDIGLIRVAEWWKYLRGFQEPPPGWAAPDFDDQFWTEGMSGFSTPGGYGESTLFADYGFGYTTLFFRKRFELDETERVKQLLFRVDYDDGIVVYLNGREVARRGVPGSPDVAVPASSLVSSHPRGWTELIDLSAGIPFLRDGQNVLAVQILGSSSFDWSMAFVPELLANFARTPCIQNTTFNSTQIAWKTHSPADSLVEFGTGIDSATTLNVAFGQTNHLATLKDLLPGTRYFYRVALRFPNGETWSEWSSFRTFEPSGPVTFTVFGDSGWASIQQYQVASQLQRTDTDLIMHLGDLTYTAITERNSDLRVLSVYAQQLRTTPMFVAWGNHDALVDLNVALDVFHLPTNNVTGTEHFYSFDHGDVHFVALWSDLAAKSAYHPGSTQYDWLDRDLAASPKPWKFIFFHHCWRTSSLHARDDYDLNGVYDMTQLDAVAELASRRGVQAIFQAHDHCFERFTPRRGVVSFTSGGGGASLYGISAVHPDSAEYQARYHFLRVGVTNDTATVQAIDELGRLFDTFHIPRGSPPSLQHTSSWHRPSIESIPSDDADGNIAGQSFDFAGPPILPMLGRATSTGRLFVNNDAEHLYLGFDEVLLHPSEEVHLFIEPPNAGPPLDLRRFRFDLSLTNFAPSIVGLFGDELADLPYPSTTNGPTRQGLRFLRDDQPLVPGQLLQQFNRSPQRSPTLYEQNANFIEAALPLASLNAAPGDQIRLAAAVGLRSSPAPEAWRLFDTGGIFLPDQPASRPIQVRLAAAPPSDTDDDLMPDHSELLAGTDPRDPASHLRLTSTILPNRSVRLTWNAVPGRWYRLESSTQVEGNFRDLDPSFPRRAARPIEQFIVPAGLAGIRPPFEYYRVVLVPE